MIRKANSTDIPTLLDMAQTFINETSYGVEFDSQVSASYLTQIISYPLADVLIADGFAGVAILAASYEFQRRPFCYVAKFYVKPDRRNAGSGRELMEAIGKWAKEKDCSHTFVTATAGLDPTNQKLFINLMKKYGFEESGPVLFREEK